MFVLLAEGAVYFVIGEYKDLAVSTIKVNIEVFDLECLVEFYVMNACFAIQFNLIMNSCGCIVDYSVSTLLNTVKL